MHSNISRRQFFVGAGGLAGLAMLPGAAWAADAAAPNRVVVIGAGIVGAAIAYNLAKRGCEVTVLEKRAPASQASGNSFAWINASWFDRPDSYLNLRTHSLNEWHRLGREVELPIHWGGSLEWTGDDESTREMLDGVRRTQQLGVPSWIVDGEQAMDIEPNLAVPPKQTMTWSSRDGAVDPAGATRALLRQVEADGGKVVYPAEVTAIETSATNAVVTTQAGSHEADLLIVAAGAGASEISALLELPVDPIRSATPGIIVTTEPMARLVDAVIYNHETHFHQLPDGRLLVGEKAGAPATSEHQALLSGRPNAYPSEQLAQEHAARVFAVASRYLPALSEARAANVGVGWRPLPKDGLPVIGHLQQHPRVYFAAMHSGVTLAPIVGHFAAMEILDGVRIEPLSPFRYERFV